MQPLAEEVRSCIDLGKQTVQKLLPERQAVPELPAHKVVIGAKRHWFKPGSSVYDAKIFGGVLPDDNYVVKVHDLNEFKGGPGEAATLARSIWMSEIDTLTGARLLPTAGYAMLDSELRLVFKEYHDTLMDGWRVLDVVDPAEERWFLDQTIPVVAEAYAKAHDRGFTLGDIKPENVMLRGNDTGGLDVVWIDPEEVGLPERLRNHIDPTTFATINARRPQWMTPTYAPMNRLQNVSNPAPYTHAEDAESFGVMLSALLFGLHGAVARLDYGKSCNQLHRERLTFSQNSLQERAENLGLPGIEKVVTAAMAGKYSSMRPLADAVQEVFSH